MQSAYKDSITIYIYKHIYKIHANSVVHKGRATLLSDWGRYQIELHQIKFIYWFSSSFFGCDCWHQIYTTACSLYLLL